MKPIYLDYQSTTPLDQRVSKAMSPYFSECFFNPASAHADGLEAARAVEHARAQVAALINADPERLYFTNSATESNNIILQGTLNAHRKISDKVSVVITTNTEHSSIKNTIKHLCLKDSRFFNPQLKINGDGELNLDDLDKLLKSYFRDQVVLVSVIGANNEIATIHNLQAIGDICKKHRALLHSDITQLVGKVDIDVEKLNIFALTFNAHKIYGPKGVGALYIREPSKVEPLIHGGYQNTFSSGTQNVPAIVGFGAACAILQKEGKKENERIAYRRDLLWRGLSASIPDIFVNGTMTPGHRLTNNLNITIKGVKAEVFVKGIEDLIVSGGSACNSGNTEISPVIQALGTPYPDCAIRISLGRWTTVSECYYAIKRIAEITESVRKQ